MATREFSGETITGSSQQPRMPLYLERKARGLSREDLSALTGLSARTIYAIETGENRPHKVTRMVLSLVLGIPPAELFSAEPFPRTADEPTAAGEGPHDLLGPSPAPYDDGTPAQAPRVTTIGAVDRPRCAEL